MLSKNKWNRPPIPEINPPCFYGIDGEIHFLDIHAPYVLNDAQNGNQGSKWAYFPEGRISMTGLNEVFLIAFFRISVDWA